MFDWIQEHRALLFWTAVASGALLVASAFLVPFVVARIPADYFSHRQRPHDAWARRSPIVRYSHLAGKNALGAVFILAGIAMLALPGQGLLTIIVGVFLLDFPGKYKVEQRVVARPAVLRAINWLRKRAGRQPLQPPPPKAPA